MNPNRSSVLDFVLDDERGLHTLERQVWVVVVVLLGLSQVLLGLGFMGSSWSGFAPTLWPVIVLGAGGWLLIGIGVNLARGKGAFAIEGTSGWVSWLGTVVAFALAVGMTVGTGVVVLS